MAVSEMLRGRALQRAAVEDVRVNEERVCYSFPSLATTRDIM